MRVHIVDPSAYTPPYDHALCSALAAAGAEVDLYTSRFNYGPAPAPRGYVRHEHFYRLAHGAFGSRSAGSAPAAAPGPRSHVGQAAKLLEHVPDMLRYRRLAQSADIVHFQWLTVQPLDLHLLPRRLPGSRGPRLVLTAHDIMPREPRPGQRAAQARLYERFDAIVVHSEHGRARLTDELGVDGRRVHVIPHGVLAPWSGGQATEPASSTNGAGLPPGFAEFDGTVALFIGLLRPYKGLDLLIEAWRALERRSASLPAGDGAEHRRELWVVGMERMDIGALRAQAPGDVRFLTRFVSDAELGAFLRRADLVVLPYREIDASGAAFSALGAAAPLLLSDAGGFPEIAATGAARTVPAGDPKALAAALGELLADPGARARMAQQARAAAGGVYGWEGIAATTLELYGRLLGENPGG